MIQYSSLFTSFPGFDLFKRSVKAFREAIDIFPEIYERWRTIVNVPASGTLQGAHTAIHFEKICRAIECYLVLNQPITKALAKYRGFMHRYSTTGAAEGLASGAQDTSTNDLIPLDSGLRGGSASLDRDHVDNYSNFFHAAYYGRYLNYNVPTGSYAERPNNYPIRMMARDWYVAGTPNKYQMTSFLRYLFTMYHLMIGTAPNSVADHYGTYYPYLAEVNASTYAFVGMSPISWVKYEVASPAITQLKWTVDYIYNLPSIVAAAAEDLRGFELTRDFGEMYEKTFTFAASIWNDYSKRGMSDEMYGIQVFTYFTSLANNFYSKTGTDLAKGFDATADNNDKPYFKHCVAPLMLYGLYSITYAHPDASTIQKYYAYTP